MLRLRGVRGRRKRPAACLGRLHRHCRAFDERMPACRSLAFPATHLRCFAPDRGDWLDRPCHGGGI
jgi:hypothetical protein